MLKFRLHSGASLEFNPVQSIGFVLSYTSGNLKATLGTLPTKQIALNFYNSSVRRSNWDTIAKLMTRNPELVEFAESDNGRKLAEVWMLQLQHSQSYASRMIDGVRKNMLDLGNLITEQDTAQVIRYVSEHYYPRVYDTPYGAIRKLQRVAFFEIFSSLPPIPDHLIRAFGLINITKFCAVAAQGRGRV